MPAGPYLEQAQPQGRAAFEQAIGRLEAAGYRVTEVDALADIEAVNARHADLIAAGLSPLQPAAALFRAGRLMLQEIDDHANHGRNFAFETTLAGLGYVRRIRQWREKGYVVKLIYLPLATPEEAIKRVEQRVKQGGHDIPEAVVRRRFGRSLRNFQAVYRDIVHVWQVLDRRGHHLLVVREGDNR